MPNDVGLSGLVKNSDLILIKQKLVEGVNVKSEITFFLKR